jgi:hypothetical protein
MSGPGVRSGDYYRAASLPRFAAPESCRDDRVNRLVEPGYRCVSLVFRLRVRLVKDVHETAWGTRELVIHDDQGHTLYFGEAL